MGGEVGVEILSKRGKGEEQVRELGQVARKGERKRGADGWGGRGGVA